MGQGNHYPWRIDVDFDKIKKNEIYFIDYKFIKEVNKKIYEEFINYHAEGIYEKNLNFYDKEEKNLNRRFRKKISE